MAHLDRLESEAIHALREAAIGFARPAMLYSVGKDSSVLLHLALKAFHPAPLPFPLLHIDTTWKFREMYAFRDRMAAAAGARLIVHVNEEGRQLGLTPFEAGDPGYIDVMKTQALRQALALHGFDAAIAGARRDEEPARAKERMFSIRQPGQRWDPKSQRPEFWRLANCRLAMGQSMRVFPLSNWTERDVWQYVRREGIAVVPLYFACNRPVVERDGRLIVVDEPERMALRPGETATPRQVRFRTLGCWPLTGAIASQATSVEAILAELEDARLSERHGRVIHGDAGASSLEIMKRDGYF
ncbi:MAG: sulfate adenylyltransferase subunit CysD [Azospirillaceae bacterium]